MFIKLEIKDDEGMTPYEIAMEESNSEVVDYLDTLQSVFNQIGKNYLITNYQVLSFFYAILQSTVSVLHVELGCLVYAPDSTTAATYALNNGECLTSSISLTPPLIMMSFDFDLELTVFDHCMYVCLVHSNQPSPS